jgi:hypothetical protein
MYFLNLSEEPREQPPVIFERRGQFNVPAGGIYTWPSGYTHTESYQTARLDEFGVDELQIRVVDVFEGVDESGNIYRATTHPPIEYTISRSATVMAGLSLESTYPARGDTIPWIPNMLAVRFNPYVDSLRGVTYNLELTDDVSGATHRNTRTLTWPHGPRRSQGFSSPDDEDRARYSIVNVRRSRPAVAPDWAPWASSLVRGRTYRWNVQGDFRDTSSETRRNLIFCKCVNV